MEKVEVFRSGTWTGLNGTSSWTPEQVREIARRYNERQAASDRAPMTRGHPTGSGPAYGWVKTLDTMTADDGAEILLADFEDYNPAFMDAIKRGEYRGRSI